MHRQHRNRALKKEDLALYGGNPVRQVWLPYGHHAVEPDDIEAVVSVLRGDWITTGPKVGEFEEALAAYVGTGYAVSFSSGTAALHGAASAAGLESGTEAITTPLTFCATANCALYTGATPVFADVCSDTLNIDPDEAAKRVTPRTKAIFPVDYAGHPADLEAILSLADRHGLMVIEDATHALGADYSGQKIGGISHMTVFSFHPVKHITTGEGGMVTTNDPELARRLRMFRNHGIDLDARERQRRRNGQWYYEMVALGYNYRLSDIGCALGLSQLRRLEGNLARRSEIAARYSDAFKDLSAIIPPHVRQNANPAWHLYPVRLDLARLSADRGEMFRALWAEGLGVNVHYIPVHLHPFYRKQFGYRGGEYPVSEEAYERLITLPLFHGMTDQDVKDVIEAMNKVLSSYAR